MSTPGAQSHDNQRMTTAPPSQGSTDRSGLITPLLGFLDRNLSRFSQPVRDMIGIGVLLLLVSYVLNGLFGSTYIRGQLRLDREGRKIHAVGWRVLLGDYEAVTNEKGWWTLPLVGNGIPGRIRLEVEDPGVDANGNRRERVPMGEVYALGPWPLWNTFKPMNNYLIDVYPDKTPKERLQMASGGLFELLSVRTVSAQSKVGPQPSRPLLPDTQCALSLDEVSVGKFPGLFRSSGRAYFQIYLNGNPVPENTLMYGTGIGSNVGQFPLQSDKELWLPVRTGSDEKYAGLLANLTSIATCSHDAAGSAKIQPKGRIELKMLTDRGDILNSFDLSAVLASPNQELTLNGDPNRKTSIKLQAIAHGYPNTDAEVVSIWRKGAQAGDVGSMNNLALGLLTGQRGLSKDYNEAVTWFRKSAAAGSPFAMDYLGAIYSRQIETGQSLPKDDAQALMWFHKAAEAGYSSAMISLGYSYEIGALGLPKDDGQVVAWYRKAAEAGDVRAMTLLGLMYEGGRGGLPRDDGQAVTWYRKALEGRGDSRAMTRLGLMYESGRGGLPKDNEEAAVWYRKAVDAGDSSALEGLKRLGK